MQPKKVLVISAIPTHPQNVGNRTRIYNFLSTLKRGGYEIHFVYENREICQYFPLKSDIKAMREAWDELYIIPLSYHVIASYIDMQIGRLGIWLKHTFPGLYHSLKNLERKVKGKKSAQVDDMYNPAVDKFIKKISKKVNFDVVLAEYIFQSKALRYFNGRALKIIDTHDALTSAESYQANRHLKSFIAYTNEDEAKALNRADVVIAIQDKEKEFFSKLTKKRAVTIGHLAGLHSPIKRKTDRKNIFFIGFTNSANKYGINFFIKEAFTKIRLRFLDAKLIVGGRICNFVEPQEGIIKLGEIIDIEKGYDLADIVICPLFFGTGIKIKNVEALAYCKPLVTTSFGTNGIEDGAGEAFLVANNVQEFINAIEKIFSDKNFYEELSENAYRFIKTYNEKNVKTVREIFNIK